MIPLVATKKELEITRAQVDKVAQQVFAEAGMTIEYIVGTMIELPRAALAGGRDRRDRRVLQLRHQRSDADRVRPVARRRGQVPAAYVELGILAKDPFVSIDVEGVGAMVRIAAEKGRPTKPDLKLGICGEHGGDPASIAFCEEVGLDYVSCSPTACRSRGWPPRRRRWA